MVRKRFAPIVLSLAIGVALSAFGVPIANATHQIKVNIGDASFTEGNGNCQTDTVNIPVTLTAAPGHY
jgi:hypothetical protein